MAFSVLYGLAFIRLDAFLVIFSILNFRASKFLFPFLVGRFQITEKKKKYNEPQFFPSIRKQHFCDRRFKRDNNFGRIDRCEARIDGWIGIVVADKRTQPSPGRERTFLFLPFVHGRTDNEQMAGYVYARDFQPNWQANTSQRMQISQTICQSSRWPCPLLHGREGHFNRQSFTIRLRSIGSLHSFSRISLSPPPSLSLSIYLSLCFYLCLSATFLFSGRFAVIPATPSRFRCVPPSIQPVALFFSSACSQSVTIKTPSVDSRSSSSSRACFHHLRFSSFLPPGFCIFRFLSLSFSLSPISSHFIVRMYTLFRFEIDI